MNPTTGYRDENNNLNVCVRIRVRAHKGRSGGFNEWVDGIGPVMMMGNARGIKRDTELSVIVPWYAIKACRGNNI